MGSVCVNGRCGFREKSERRDCPKCGWLMLDGPLPATGSIAPPPRHLSFANFAPAIAGGVVIFFGAIGMTAASWASADPVAAHAPAPVVASVEPAPAAPITTPAPVAAAAPEPVKALAAAAKPAAKRAAAKPVAKKSAAKKKTAKKVTKKTVARR